MPPASVLVGNHGHALHHAQDTAAGDHAVAALYRGQHLPLVLLLLLLRSDQQEIEDDEDQHQRQELRRAAEGTGEALGVGGVMSMQILSAGPGLRCRLRCPGSVMGADHSFRHPFVKFFRNSRMDQHLIEQLSRIAAALERLAPAMPPADRPGRGGGVRLAA